MFGYILNGRTYLFAPTIIIFFLSVFLFFIPYAHPVTADVTDISNPACRQAGALDYLDTVLTELNNAKDTIDVAMYAFYADRDDSAKTSDKLLQALIEAKQRGVAVKVYLDACSGSRKSNHAAYAKLKAAGITVYFLDDKYKLHAKLIVIDQNTVIEGSANWTRAACGDNLESNTLLRSPEFAALKSDFFRQLDKVIVLDDDLPWALSEKVSVANEFLLNKELASVMLRDNDEHTFNAYFWLLQKDTCDWVNIDYKVLARYLGMSIKPDAPKYRYDIRRVITKLKDKYNLLDYQLDKKNNLKVKLRELSGGYFNLPKAYWEYGLDKLNLREKFAYFISLYEHEASPLSEYWWRDLPGLAEKYHVEKNVILKGLNTLEDLDILEIHRSARQGDSYDDRLANRYRLKLLLSPKEKAQALKAMRKSYGAKLFNEARAAAALLGRENHLAVVERFIILIKQYGFEKVQAAAKKVSGYAHNNPMRDIAYIQEFVQNSR